MRFIQKLMLCVGLALLVADCGRGDALEIPAGSDVTVRKQDGVEIRGTLVAVSPDQIVVEAAGTRTSIPRSEIRAISTLSVTVSADTAAERGQTDASAADASSSGRGRR